MCKETGTFDNTTSSTYKYVTGGFNNVVSNIGTSDIISETLLVAGSTLEGMKLGYVVRHGRNTTRQLPAIAGLSLGCEKGRCNHTRSFTQALYEAGHIKKRAYSIFLGLGDGSVPGQLLMGGIDRAKRQGPVYKHKLVNPLESPTGAGVIGEVVLSSSRCARRARRRSISHTKARTKMSSGTRAARGGTRPCLSSATSRSTLACRRTPPSTTGSWK